MILNKITVGNKLILEIDHDPTVVNTPAPIGSQALRNNGGTGQAYLKFGSGDTQWASYQTGAEPSDWKFTTDANQLNVATAKAYFGTKTGSNFDIEMQRNGIAKITLATSDVKVHADLTFLDTSTAYVRHNTGGINFDVATSLGLKSSTIIENINNMHQRYLRNGTGSPVAMKIEDFKTENVPNASTFYTPYFADQAIGSHRLIKAELHYIADGGVSMMLEKTIHIDSANQIVLIQDDYTSKTATLASVQCAVSYTGGQVEFALTGLPAGTNKKVSMFICEKSKF